MGGWGRETQTTGPDHSFHHYHPNPSPALPLTTNPPPCPSLPCPAPCPALPCPDRYFAASPWGPGITLHRNKRAHELLDDLRRAGDRAGTSGDSSEARASASAGPGPRLFDLVFIDADKKIYREYLQTLMGETESGTGTETESETGTEEGSVGQGEGEEESSRRRSGTSSGSGLCLLAEGALVIVDNTLWKGLVLAHGGEDLAGHTPEAHLYGNPDRLKVGVWGQQQYQQQRRIIITQTHTQPNPYDPLTLQLCYLPMSHYLLLSRCLRRACTTSIRGQLR